MHRHPVFQMPAHSLCKDATLDFSSDSNHIIHTISVRNMRNILVEDGSGIKLGRDVMGRCTNDLHPSLIRLLIRVCTDKGWQERVMNINHRLAIGFQELRR